MWQSKRMKKLRRVLAGLLSVLLLMSLNISSLAERGGEIFPVSRSSVISHTPADTEQTEQTKETDRSEDSGTKPRPARPRLQTRTCSGRWKNCRNGSMRFRKRVS